MRLRGTDGDTWHGRDLIDAGLIEVGDGDLGLWELYRCFDPEERAKRAGCGELDVAYAW